MQENTTIAALATPPGSGGIAIVRISGPQAEDLLRAVFRPAGNKDGFDSHVMSYGHVMCEGKPFDECMAVLMRAPRTYTREDVAEVHVHGGDWSAQTLLNTLFKLGAIPAEPGEFTRRAFLNGRIDLSRAEAVMQMIAATGDRAGRAALHGLQGGASAFIRRAQEELLSILSGVAAALDYPEEVDEEEATTALAQRSRALSDSLLAACDERAARILDSGLEVVISGKPNVGKSSLLNTLLGEERAIVTDEAGTTRDVVRASAMLGGVRVNFSDTAGIRQSDQRVEKIGIERARQAMRTADLVLVVLDQGIAPDDEDREILQLASTRPHLVVLNKSDLPPAAEQPQGILISARTGEGLDTLRDAIIQHAGLAGEGDLHLARHMRLARKAAEALQEGAAAMQAGEALDLCAVHLHEALYALGEVTGDQVTEDLLDRVFADFCVGK